MKKKFNERFCAKRIFACVSCIFLLGFADTVFAQENPQVDETTVSQNETETVAETSADVKTNAVEETKTEPAISEEENNDESTEPAEGTPGGIVKTIKFVTSLPLTYDFGCEPTLNGSLIYLNVKYQWSEEKQIFTRVLFNYGTTLSLDPSSKFEVASGADLKKYEDLKKAIDFRLIPWGKQINSSTTKGRYFTIEPGMNFRLEPETIDMTIATYTEADESYGKMFFNFDMNQKDKRYIIRPYYSTTIATPLGKLFSVSLDLLYAPLYYYWGGNKVDFSVKGLSDKQGQFTESIPTINMDYKGLAENYVDANLVIGLFNRLAASARFIYERQHKTDFSLANDFSTVETENKYEKLSLKIGGSLINIGKASMRIKAGIFHQWDWEYNHNEESWYNTRKWIFGVGMRNLY